MRRLGGAEPMATDSVFALFSCTKAITGTAILQLVTQVLIDLDAPAKRYAPEAAAAAPLRRRGRGRQRPRRREAALGLAKDKNSLTMPMFPALRAHAGKDARMRASQSNREPPLNIKRMVSYGAFVLGLAIAAPAVLAAGGGGGGGGDQTNKAPQKDTGGGTANRTNNPSDVTNCQSGQVWDAKRRKCLQRHSGVLPDSELTEYAYALAKADRFQEAIDVLESLDNPNTPRALNYRGYATRKLGHVDEGIGYYLKSIALDPDYPQVREYLGEAYVIEGKFDLAKDQLATIEKICGSKDCEYYGELAAALGSAHAL